MTPQYGRRGTAVVEHTYISDVQNSDCPLFSPSQQEKDGNLLADILDEQADVDTDVEKAVYSQAIHSIYEVASNSDKSLTIVST